MSNEEAINLAAEQRQEIIDLEEEIAQLTTLNYNAVEQANDLEVMLQKKDGEIAQLKFDIIHMDDSVKEVEEWIKKWAALKAYILEQARINNNSTHNAIWSKCATEINRKMEALK